MPTSDALILIITPETQVFDSQQLDVASLAARGRENHGCCSCCLVWETTVHSDRLWDLRTQQSTSYTNTNTTIDSLRNSQDNEW